MKIFNTDSSILLKRSLDLLMRHNRNLAENISSSNVEGYKRKPTSFLDELVDASAKNQLRVTNARHIRPDSLQNVPEYEKGPVQITREMADLAQNQIRFEFSTRMLRRKFDGLTTAITGRIR